jgi:hypothetical protein
MAGWSGSGGGGGKKDQTHMSSPGSTHMVGVGPCVMVADVDHRVMRMSGAGSYHGGRGEGHSSAHVMGRLQGTVWSVAAVHI